MIMSLVDFQVSRGFCTVHCEIYRMLLRGFCGEGMERWIAASGRGEGHPDLETIVKAVVVDGVCL